MFGLECTELPRCGGYYGFSILLVLILATLRVVHANTHPLAFALSVAGITQHELRTCAAAPGAQLAAAVCIPHNKTVGFAWVRDWWEDAHICEHVPAEHCCAELVTACWRQLDGRKEKRALLIPFCFSLKWRNGSALHVVFSCALSQRKDSQSNLSRQRFDVSPNALDNSLSAVKTSPSAIKTKLLNNTPLLPSCGS